MLFCFLLELRALISYDCDLGNNEDFVISLFYDKGCENCDHLISFLDELDSRIERNQKNATIQYKNCDVCTCTEDEKSALPTIKVNKMGSEIAKIDGRREYKDILNVIIRSSGYDQSIFLKNIKTHPGHVVQLKERDFFSGFSGPWLILFYGSRTDIKRDLVYKIAKDYSKTLNVGEINGNSSPVLTRRFSLGYLPAIVALYDGLIVGYNAKDTYNDLKNFVDELIRPSFESITLSEIKHLNASHAIENPIFVVLYKDVNIANEYYRGISHEYKFSSKIYKSNDEALIKEVNVDFQDADLKVVCYKNKIFHHSPFDATKNDKILEWIWHTHYPLVTKVNNDDFYAIMHGLKPVILLLTHSEDFVDKFEKASEKTHKGMPFSDFIFATIDVTKYPLFIPSLIPKIVAPWIVIYNPTTKLFYTQSMRITAKSLENIVDQLIEKYNREKLPEYTSKSYDMKIIGFFIFLCACGVYLGQRRIFAKRLKLVEI